MRSRLLHEHEGQRTFVLVFEAGDDVCDNLRSFSRESRACSISSG